MSPARRVETQLEIFLLPKIKEVGGRNAMFMSCSSYLLYSFVICQLIHVNTRGVILTFDVLHHSEKGLKGSIANRIDVRGPSMTCTLLSLIIMDNRTPTYTKLHIAHQLITICECEVHYTQYEVSTLRQRSVLY